MTTNVCLNRYINTLPRPVNLVNKPQDINDQTWQNERICCGITASGLDLDLETLKAVWSIPLSNGRTCVQVFNDVIHTNNGQYIFNPKNFQDVSENMEYLLSKYFNQTPNPPLNVGGHNLLLAGAVGWDQFQNTLVQACVNIPGSCNNAQKTLCDSCSRDEISNNPDLLHLCGCFAPILDPNIYTRTIPVECDPLCNKLSVSKIVNPTNGEVVPCNDTVCVMDNFSVTATKSDVNYINISQICPGCTAETGCICIVDTSITNMSASLGLDTPTTFQQFCGPNATCIEINSIEQTSTVVPCDQYFTGAITPTYNSSVPPVIWLIVLIMVILVLLALAALVFADNNTELIKPVNPNKLSYPINTNNNPLSSTDF